MLFADDPVHLQFLIYSFANACSKFELTISLKNICPSTKNHISSYYHRQLFIVNGKRVHILKIHQKQQSVTQKRDRLTNQQGNFYFFLPRNACVEKHFLTIKTKMAAHNSCFLSTLLYGNHFRTVYAGQKRKLLNGPLTKQLRQYKQVGHNTQLCYLDVDYQQGSR